MATFKDLFHYAFDRNAVFHLEIPLERKLIMNVDVHKVDMSDNNCKRIVCDLDKRNQYMIELYPDNEIQITQYPFYRVPEPVYTKYFPVDTDIEYDAWKQYLDKDMVLMITIICHQLNTIISSWIEEDINGE